MSYGLDFGEYRYEVMGSFDRSRLDERLQEALELIAEIGSWPWPGSLEEELASLVTEAYAFGRAEAEGKVTEAAS